jgi:regulator of protease activity HflC (stomatin/prohibitin superfamily)
VSFVLAFLLGFVAAAAATPALLGTLRGFGLYTTVAESHCKVFVLFGRVIGVLSEPGLHVPLLSLGPRALLVPFFGRIHDLDLRLDQNYLRSQAVNTEEGTPMGIGTWYEMRISDSVAYLFENTDPRGSLAANVANATVRGLSNLPLERMLEDRHSMSRVVREEVSPKSRSWGYELGSVYIRKVHFRDRHMIGQIEQKVVNRLRQVTSAIRQAGENQVDIVTSAAEKLAAVEFARAKAVRPQLVGKALSEISRDPEVSRALFDILETQKLLDGRAELTLLPRGGNGQLLSPLLAAQESKPDRTSEPGS